ncbi:MAG: GNAT family N-acetyltransferase [Chloroflexota bacterium]
MNDLKEQSKHQLISKRKTEDIYSNVWLVPCFFVRSDVRGLGINKSLLEAAVRLADKHDAKAIDGFPFTNEKRRSSCQIHVGFESTFLACAFEPIRRPSQSRTVMHCIL